ncbi:hypothetical protein [Thalassomonas sp. RHCl1]|uniref:hypothetical protein n=1 Tax=Thalassomonas sp. RHCl1 TaxID=2995320 RepID=UPI00248BEFB0|nr:hypothetical protein [Thalassomonas sp. RHCl1]
MKKFIYISYLSVACFLSFFFLNEPVSHLALVGNDPLQSPKFASVVSSNASWWQKNDGALPVKKHLKVTVSHHEKLSDFLELSPSSEWQPVPAANGVAIASYRLNSGKNNYQLAIIRMKKGMPLSAIMNIWQQKAGLPATDNFKAVRTIKSQNNQLFDLYQLSGSKQSIALAVHAGEKYTFFRLSGTEQIDEPVLTKFTDLIASSSII